MYCPVQQYLIEQLPESVRETTSKCVAFSDLTLLTTQQLDDVCKWLLSRVVMFSGNLYDCVRINLTKKNDLVGTAAGYA